MKTFLILILLSFALPTALLANEACHDHLPTITFHDVEVDRTSLRRGFFVWDETDCWYIPSVPLVDYGAVTPAYFETRAIWMSAGVIEVSATFNGVDMNGVEGFVALLNCDLVGQDVLIRPPNGQWIRVRVADCARPWHEYFHAVYVDSGLELSYELAQRFGALDQQNPGGGVGIYNFEVCLNDFCSGEPINYTDWYLDRVRQIRSARR